MKLNIEVSCTSSRQKKHFALEDGMSVEVGRSHEDLHVASDPRLSRRHFRIRHADGQIEITHLSRTNPTLVASEGSKDFKKVTDTRTETGGCRIIAGSHRFVLMIEKAETGLDKTLPEGEGVEGVEGVDFWSDVDDGFQEGAPVVKTTAPANPTSPTLRNQPSPKKAPSPPKKRDMFDDDDLPARETQPQEKSKKPSPRVNKPFFPVADDFFDD